VVGLSISTPEYVDRLRDLVERATPGLRALSDDRSALAPAPGKWSPREVIGHLVDSATNNHRRFVDAQLHDPLVFPGYDQEAWVRLQRYASAGWAELVTLWRSYNLHLARVMATMPEEARLRRRSEHNLDAIAWRTVPADEPTTLDYLMRDYVDHLHHHLKQIFGADW
jgi:DinB superfamily